jgi:outer membrane protein TolC
MSTAPQRSRFFAPSLLTAAVAAALLMSGCSVVPKPFTQEEVTTVNQADRAKIRASVPGIATAVSLEEAIARALKFNLEHRTRMMEQALASGQLEASRYDMLPKLLANAGYSWRDDENIRRATDSVTGLPSLANPYISTDRSHITADIGLTWSLLDFGASYYTAKQNADRLLIASERRRKSMHTLIQNVRTAYWRALAAQALGERIQATIGDAEVALSDARKVTDERVKNPAESLRYQRNLLENLRLLESVQRELASARIELANLMGAEPGERIQLVEPADSNPAKLDMSMQRMEELALNQNADLRESFYNARIAAADTRKALLRLLPGLTLDYGYKHDDDSYLINNQWQEAGVRVSFNLFNLLSGPKQMQAAEMNEKVHEARRMALQMAVLTQVHLARHQYDDAQRQYLRADAIFNVDNQLAGLVQSQAQSQMASGLERISANVTSILSSVRRYQAMAKVQEAASRVQATLGLEPEIGSLDDTDLPTLQKSIEKTLKQWAQTEQPAAPRLATPAPVTAPAPAQVAEVPVAPGTPAAVAVTTETPAQAVPAPIAAALPAKPTKAAKATASPAAHAASSSAASSDWYRPARKPALLASNLK